MGTAITVGLTTFCRAVSRRRLSRRVRFPSAGVAQVGRLRQRRPGSSRRASLPRRMPAAPAASKSSTALPARRCVWATLRSDLATPARLCCLGRAGSETPAPLRPYAFEPCGIGHPAGFVAFGRRNRAARRISAATFITGYLLTVRNGRRTRAPGWLCRAAFRCLRGDPWANLPRFAWIAPPSFAALHGRTWRA